MKKYEGYKQKISWTEAESEKGLNYIQIHKNGKPAGFIEFTDGEQAWRALHADGYIVIHCLWVGITGEGIGSMLIERCIEYATEKQKKGVVVVTNADASWAPSEQIFEKKRFRCVDEAPFEFKLYAYLIGEAVLPFFPSNWNDRLARFSDGLTVLRTFQCPYLDVATSNLAEAASSLNIPCNIIELNTREEVMELAPTPYGVFHVIYKGKLVSFHRMTPRSFAQHLKRIDADLL
jgi:hypothetical protein